MITSPTHYRAFDSAWFQRNQKLLVRALNAPVVGGELRSVLGITRHDRGYDRPIVEIGPNYYLMFECLTNDGCVRLSGDFRGHWKYSKRLYCELGPVWWLLHAWDALVADRWLPRLSYGFATLTAKPDSDPETATVDGYVANDLDPSEDTWTNVRNSTGNSAGPSFASPYCVSAVTTATGARSIYRSIYLFDLSAAGAGAVFTAGGISLYGTSATDVSGGAAALNVYASNPASNTNLVGGDYNTIGTTPFSDGPITVPSWITSGFNFFDLNAAGIATLGPNVCKFGAREANYDVADASPGASKSFDFKAYYAEETGDATDPKIDVDFTPAESGSGARFILPAAFGRQTYGIGR